MDVGGWINHELCLPATGTHHGRFTDDFTVDSRYAIEASQTTAGFLEGHFHNHLIARYDRTLETGIINASKIIKLAWLQFTHAFKCQNAGGLCHRFQNQNAGKNRFTREMPLEKRLVKGDILYGAQIFVFFKIQHAIHQQKRITVRQQL
ncbi:Hypothetical Protein PANA_0804 [Pantoea ananatis LMG 20103]|uniref:Uncharacterized protein n=1 Tax=Pantoea ananatis (strain LMG 20103) TaxID=706191 RepID=D4GKE2_PANAM|nr:Hypothetical Protein PANA_0804 [Pantoea ananatis LMG 20103]